MPAPQERVRGAEGLLEAVALERLGPGLAGRNENENLLVRQFREFERLEGELDLVETALIEVVDDDVGAQHRVLDLLRGPLGQDFVAAVGLLVLGLQSAPGAPDDVRVDVVDVVVSQLLVERAAQVA